MDSRKRDHPALSFVTDGEGYELLGCYRRPGPPGIRGEIFEDENEYITLIPVPDYQSTVMSCLEGCGTSVPRGAVGQIYSHVAVGEGRICLCGITPSKRARRVDRDLCDVPCNGDPGVSCGGRGYALLYAAGSCLEAQGTDGPGMDATDEGVGCTGEIDGEGGPDEGAGCTGGTDGEGGPGRPTTGATVATQTVTTQTTIYSASATSSLAPASTSTVSPPRNNTRDDRFPSNTSPPSSVLSSVDAKSTAAVVLGSVAAATVLAAAALALFYIRRRRRRRLKPELQRRGVDTPPSQHHPTPPPGPGPLQDPAGSRAAASALQEGGGVYASSVPPSNGTAARHSHVSALTSGSGSRQPGGGHSIRNGSAADTELSSTAGPPPAILTASHVRVRQAAAGGVYLVDASEPSRRYTMPVSAPKEGLAGGGTCRSSAAYEHGWV